MKNFTYLAVLCLALNFSFAQEQYSRVKIPNPNEQTIRTIALQGIDFSCGAKRVGNDVIIELSETEINSLRQSNIPFSVEIENVQEFYQQRSNSIELEEVNRSESQQTLIASRASVSSIIKDNIIQYTGSSEIEFVEPQNFPDVNALTMGGCLTLSEMEAELDAMRSYSQSNSLDIVSVKQDASSTGQKTWGNPTNNFTNQHNNGPSTYSGTGSTRWNPQTIYYIRITGNESTTPEGTKPQILYTSMIHSRELSALMNNIYFMWYIIENYNTDPAIKELVDNNELYFVPVVNPDGLRYNEVTNPTGGGMQRKNLRPLSNGTIDPSRGVDLNRNFDYYWGLNEVGSSSTQTASNYRGPSRESEPETQIMVDFIENRNFKSAVWNHSYANSVPHPYGGDPNENTNREDEYYRWHEEMTRYNRYLYGATIFYESNGLPDDWMMGGAADNNGSTGLNQAIIATTPEHGGEGFWPARSSIVPIAKKSVRLSLATAYYGGKYAKLHDLTQSDITGTTNVELDFGIERIGQTQSGFTVTVTPISSNILSITSPTTVTGIDINTTPTANTFRNQTEVTALMDLDPSIAPNDKIEYNVKFSNDNGIIYEADYEKYYSPTVLLAHDSDTENLTDEWDQSGGWAESTTDAYSGTFAIYTGTYSNNATKTLTTKNSYDFSSASEIIIQFYSKWDIERNYDFVEVLGSPNGGTSWISLNGKYTKPNATSATTSHDNKSGTYANFQANSAGQIYDGDRMDNWVMEEIVIDGNYAPLLSSNNVKIRFNFRTDALNVNESYTTTNDGFFIDDFKIISLVIPCETTVPTGLAVSNITASGADAAWNTIPSATYDIRYRETGSPFWIEVTDVSSSSYTLSSLLDNTEYEVQIRSRCLTATSDYSSSVNFTTSAITYCTSTASRTQYEHIGNVNLNGINNNTVSSPSSGYDDFTGSNIFDPIQIGSTGNSIAVTKEWPGTAYNEAVSVWIDFDKDGTFEASEKILEVGANTTATVSNNFTVPLTAGLGNTRMRVIMKYYNGSTIQNDPCESFQDGEVEDYNVFLYEDLLFTGNIWYPSAPNGTTSNEKALILDGTYSIIDDVQLSDVTIKTGATIDIAKAKSLTVNGNISKNGDLILNSDSVEYSSLIVSGAVAGDVKYNRHVYTTSATGGNDLVAPPVNGEVFTDFIATNTNIVTNPGGSLYLFGHFDKTSNSYLTYSNTETTTLDAGTGYRAASTDGGTFLFTGNVETGNINVPIVESGPTFPEWNLIGNPYPSYIKLSDFLSANVSKFNTNNAGVYGYDADDSNGDIWTIWNLAYSDANPNALIAPGQGFLVSSKTGGETVNFTPSMRSIGSSDDFIVGRSSQLNPTAHMRLKLSAGNEIGLTEFYISDQASSGLDHGYDAGHFGDIAPNFSIYSELVDNNNGVDMAVQAISYEDVLNDTRIPLGLNSPQSNNLVIELVDNNYSGYIYLEDTLEGTFTLLNSSNYTFDINNAVSGTGRFYLRFSDQLLSSSSVDIDSIQIYNTSSPSQIMIKGHLYTPTDLVIYDVQGRGILTQKLDINQTTNNVDASNLSKGVYVVQLKGLSITKTKKIIIK
ncbi:MAG: T9SS type A sorting domain-containing protein [Winogradskyella sp.]|nr:T9SS type A sorting domain-containing protein [Winogradskyella sp.]